MLNNVKKQGFTLLELLLVLALISILILGGLAMYQIQLRNFKVDKTSLQMQQWLQAGMSFYVDCNQWPTDSKQDPNIISAMMGQSPLTQDECPRYANQVRQYMPLSSDKNGPFPNSYSFGPYSNTAGSTGSLFQVSTEVGDDSTLMESIGKMIAARLPNAISAVDDTQDPKRVLVQAMVNIPGQAIDNNNRGFILDMQMVKSTELSHVKYPTNADCPTGMQAVLVNAMSAFESTKGANNDNPLGAYSSTTQINVDEANKLITPEMDVTSTYVGFGNKPDKNSVGANEVLLISACIPKEGK